jgi:cation diffusion facilitator family transporter
VLSSIVVVVGVFLSKYFGIFHADSISGVLIAAAFFVGAYSIFRESSLVLVDACKCGDIVNAIGDIAKSVKGVKEVHRIRMRQLGSYVVEDLHIVVNSNMLVLEADDIATKMEEKIRKEFWKIIEITVRIESDKAHDRHSNEFIITMTVYGITSVSDRWVNSNIPILGLVKSQTTEEGVLMSTTELIAYSR